MMNPPPHPFRFHFNIPTEGSGGARQGRPNLAAIIDAAIAIIEEDGLLEEVPRQ